MLKYNVQQRNRQLTQFARMRIVVCAYNNNNNNNNDKLNVLQIK